VSHIILKDGVDAMDFVKVTALLATSYWVPGIKLEEVQTSALNSALVVGAFLTDGTQVGYGRVVSDKTRFAYFMDVIVDPAYRKQGIGRRMVGHSMAHPDLKDVYQWVLITKDAHGVYDKLGFKPLAQPVNWMEIRNERPGR
jgi:ribosomal protein S18 acetylase RimI-like enzyme